MAATPGELAKEAEMRKEMKVMEEVKKALNALVLNVGDYLSGFVGKSFDTFCPMGPWLVTSDEVDPENLAVKCWVNDELRQDANTRDLIFDIPTLIVGSQPVLGTGRRR